MIEVIPPREAPREETLLELINSVTNPKDRAELILQERQFTLAQSELSLKRDQLAEDKTRKISPLMATLIAAGAATFSAMFTTGITQIVENRKFELAEEEFKYRTHKGRIQRGFARGRKEKTTIHDGRWFFRLGTRLFETSAAPFKRTEHAASSSSAMRSNQAMERTADRSSFKFSVTSTSSPRATRAVIRRRSSCSR